MRLRPRYRKLQPRPGNRPRDLNAAGNLEIHSALVQATAPNRPSTAAVPRPGPPHVLLAEDDDVLALQVVQMLWLEGIRTTRCIDGRDTFEAACFGQFRPDLIILDVEMPHMSGLEAARLIADFDRIRRLVPRPIVGFTSRTDSSTLLKLRSAGAVDFLPKPPLLADIAVHVKPHLVRRDLPVRPI